MNKLEFFLHKKGWFKREKIVKIACKHCGKIIYVGESLIKGREMLPEKIPVSCSNCGFTSKSFKSLFVVLK